MLMGKKVTTNTRKNYYNKKAETHQISLQRNGGKVVGKVEAEL